MRELRTRHELTQEQVATLLESDLKWYQRIEWCAKDLRASTIDRLAAVFGVTAAEFLGNEIPPTKVRRPGPGKPRKPRPASQRNQASS